MYFLLDGLPFPFAAQHSKDGEQQYGEHHHRQHD
jgi:hypothetical protein